MSFKTYKTWMATVLFFVNTMNPQIAYGAELQSIKADSESEQTSISIFVEGSDSLQNVQLQKYSDHLELHMVGARISPQMSQVSVNSSIISRIDYHQSGETAVVSMYTQAPIDQVKAATKVGLYQGEILVSVDHNLIASRTGASELSPAGAASQAQGLMFTLALIIGLCCIAMVVLYSRNFLTGFKLESAAKKQPRSHLQIKKLASIPPTKSHELSIIEISGEKLLISNGPNGVHLLTPLHSHVEKTQNHMISSSEKDRLVAQLREQIRAKVAMNKNWSSKT